jgi:uncharacterized membrane protein YhaH (DUF805 family)
MVSKFDNSTMGANPVGPVQAVINTYLGAFKWSRCISRSEFFYFVLWVYLPIFILAAISEEGKSIWDDVNPILGFIYGVNCLLLIPASVKRLHDIGRSGWWLWIGAFGVGLCVLIWWWSRPGIELKRNKFSEKYDPDIVTTEEDKGSLNPRSQGSWKE